MDRLKVNASRLVLKRTLKPELIGGVPHDEAVDAEYLQRHGWCSGHDGTCAASADFDKPSTDS